MTSPTSDPLLDRLRAATSDEYEILRELGRGGFAAVFLGRDVALDREVAIKVLTVQAAGDAETAQAEVERFRREARTVAKLNHPNIVPVYAVKAVEGLQFFVMKFIRGRSLERVLETAGRLPTELVQAILLQAGGALAFAHRNGVVHRDIKPANIMLDEDGWAVVADFGIAKVARADKLTGTGLIIGTAAYMSPEQWAGQDVSGLSDQYSLGVCAYELLTGRSPFIAETVPAMLWAHLNEVPPPITEARPDCPPPLARIVERMMEKEPAARFASLDEVTAALSTLPTAMAPDALRTELMTLATVTGQAISVEQDDSGERVVGRGALTPSGKVVRLTVLPAATTLGAGSTLRLSATPVNDTGRQLARRATAWRTLDERIATVDADGVLTAHAPGRTELVVACEGIEARVPVTVTGTEAIARRSRRRQLGALAVSSLALVATLLWQQGVIGPGTLGLASRGDSTNAADSANDANAPRIPEPSIPAFTTAQKQGSDGTPAGPEKLTADTGGRGSTRTPAGGLARADTGSQQAAPGVPAGSTLTQGSKSAGPPAESKAAEPKANDTRSTQSPPGAAPQTAADGGTTKAPAPAEPEESAPENPAVEVSAGGVETCAALRSGDKVLCWGGAAPTGAVLADAYFTKLAVGGGHICGLTPDGSAFCWGDNAQGQLGDGSKTTRAAPTPVTGNQRFVDIGVGAAHTCALAADGSAWCWGANKAGQLGDNSIDDRTRPVLVRGREQFQSLSAGGSHTCGVRASKAYCWGDGFSGQIGNAMQQNQREPFPVRTELPFKTVVTGELHSCGLTTSGRAWCWGDNRNGQLGNDTRDNRDVPDSVATDLIFTQLAAGARHTCGITSTRQLACWGENGSGQLGDGTRQRRTAPVIVARATRWKKVSTGAAHTCGITSTDAVLCWGANSRGQLGSGAAGAITLVPTAISVGPRGRD